MRASSESSVGTNSVNNIRISWIDVLRGVAIILMMPANLSIFWSAPHPLWFRVLASYAAPIFIMDYYSL